jgi:hypothetical protein
MAKYPEYRMSFDSAQNHQWLKGISAPSTRLSLFRMEHEAPVAANPSMAVEGNPSLAVSSSFNINVVRENARISGIPRPSPEP